MGKNIWRDILSKKINKWQGGLGEEGESSRGVGWPKEGPHNASDKVFQAPHFSFG